MLSDGEPEMTRVAAGPHGPVGGPSTHETIMAMIRTTSAMESIQLYWKGLNSLRLKI
jgi:hypothetical protein